MVEELERDLELSREELEEKYGKIPDNVPNAPKTHKRSETIKDEGEE